MVASSGNNETRRTRHSITTTTETRCCNWINMGGVYEKVYLHCKSDAITTLSNSLLLPRHKPIHSNSFIISLLVWWGITIQRQIVQVERPVLQAPKLKVGNREDICPCNGRWNFNKKKLFTPIKIEKWVAVNFSAKCDACYLAPELINCGRNRGVVGQSQRFLIAHFY
ncbi:protein argonaute 15 isoform X1 [Lactuca sativa]|uniref:protein argonaute 15 isoform X1 n=2 Tax=Lactuca sativa TaxID=4236 RepID=UPI000CD957EF|nr:protein argonaute 15 isoform X1 [Lactuca sativa]XP_023760988.1 protein argonaute 15 isoform X1 [Lactuca sativa]XP_052625858.1 protein argonaute 15 isoform X1 [Lactuca sativa]